MKRKAIIVDLDGTLCNTDHRQHFMEQKPKDWNGFYEAMGEDKPNEWCFELIFAMREAGVHVIFVTGRPTTYREKTLEWLEEVVVIDGIEDILWMRPEGDFRKDCEVKKEIFYNCIDKYYDILFVVDDRQQVVDMWRNLGLTCLQCAPGAF